MRLFGRPVARRNRDAIATLRRAIGVLPQDRRMLEHLPLIDNVALPLQGQRRRRRGAGRRPAGRCSNGSGWRAGPTRCRPSFRGGERGRAALARAVILSPEMILADEPAEGADREAAEAAARGC